MSRPNRIINSVAPIRVCDIGGWTDTWFARHGKVFNIAVAPFVQVQVHVLPSTGERKRITIVAENYGERYTIEEPRGIYDKHPLLEAAIDYMKVPSDLCIEVTIYSEAPSGCSTGTSAAVSVALIGALDQLTPGRLTPHGVAKAAHEIETKLLKQQCGIQDQIASAYGSVNLIEMYDYPNAGVSQLRLDPTLAWELEQRLSLIYLGVAHNSSEVHRMVIRELEAAGPEATKLEPLRRTAEDAKNAVYDRDLEALGRVMIDNTAAQEALHRDLVGPLHRQVIDIARSFRVTGWKVNGAGGEGGSVTLLSDANWTRKRQMIQAIEAANPGFKAIPIRLSPFGLRVWETPSAARPSE